MKLFVYSLALISTSVFSSTVTTNDVSGNYTFKKVGIQKLKWIRILSRDFRYWR